MARLLPQEKRQAMEELYSDVAAGRLTASRMARMTDIPCRTAHDFVAAKGINPETSRHFASRREYEDYKARKNKRINPNTGKPFSSAAEYKRYMAATRPARYRFIWLRRHGFESMDQYANNLAVDKGFSSRYERDRVLAESRKSKPENQRLSALITERLGEMGKSKAWLAHEIGVSKTMIGYYAAAESYPSEINLQNIYAALGVTYSGNGS
jgi:hypothetical protein